MENETPKPEMYQETDNWDYEDPYIIPLKVIQKKGFQKFKILNYEIL